MLEKHVFGGLYAHARTPSRHAVLAPDCGCWRKHRHEH